MLHVIQVRSHWGKDIYNEIGCLRKSSNDSKNISPQELRIWVLRQNSQPAWKPGIFDIWRARMWGNVTWFSYYLIKDPQRLPLRSSASQIISNFPYRVSWRAGGGAVTWQSQVWGLYMSWYTSVGSRPSTSQHRPTVLSRVREVQWSQSASGVTQ